MNDDFSMVQIGKQDDHGGTGDTPILGCLGMLGMVGIDVLLGYGKPDGHALLWLILPWFFCSPACLQSYGTGLGKCMKMYGFYRFFGILIAWKVRIRWRYDLPIVGWCEKTHVRITKHCLNDTPKRCFFHREKGKNTFFSWGKHETNTIQWPIQEPKLEVPTTYKTYVGFM